MRSLRGRCPSRWRTEDYIDRHNRVSILGRIWVTNEPERLPRANCMMQEDRRHAPTVLGGCPPALEISGCGRGS